MAVALPSFFKTNKLQCNMKLVIPCNWVHYCCGPPLHYHDARYHVSSGWKEHRTSFITCEKIKKNKPMIIIIKDRCLNEHAKFYRED